MGVVPDGVKENAGRIVADARTWTLDASGWDRVREQLQQLAQALDHGDEASCREALRVLGPLGASRVGRIGGATPPAEPRRAPPETLELINRLIHSLRPDAPGSPRREDGPR